MLQKLLALATLLLLVACGTPTTGSTATGATSAGGASAPVAALTRSGGIAGRTETIRLLADGQVQYENGAQARSIVVDQAVVGALQSAVAASGWQGLQEEYGKQFPDAFAYTVEAGGKTVRTYDGAENPPELQAVLDQLLSLLATAAGGG